MKYRFQWTAPIAVSPHDPKVDLPRRATCSSAPRDGGQTWEVISPDLTRNDKSKQKWSGGPITGDNTGVEIYGTVFAIAESPKQKGVIWAGSDDGLVHVTTRRRQELDERHRGDARPARVGHGQHASSRRRSTPAPPTSWSTRIGSTTCSPYLCKTTDFGKTWKRLDGGAAAGRLPARRPRGSARSAGSSTSAPSAA